MASPFQRAGGWCEPVRRDYSKSPMNSLPNPRRSFCRGVVGQDAGPALRDSR